MKPDRINYQKTFNLGNYTSERIGMEAQIDDGEDPQTKLLVLKNLVEDFHENNNPKEELHDFSIGGIQMQVPINQPIPSIDRKAVERLEILIDNASSVDELEKFKMDAYHWGIFEVYNNKLKQLS